MRRIDNITTENKICINDLIYYVEQHIEKRIIKRFYAYNCIVIILLITLIILT